MQYNKISPAIFRARPNRFVAHVEIDGQPVICHVKNTGRCRELLVPGARVWLEESGNPARKTKYDLVAVEKETPAGPLLINMDSQAPNKIFAEWASSGGFRPGLTLLRPETTYGNSRFDFYWEDLSGTQCGLSQAGRIGREGTAEGARPCARAGVSDLELVPTKGFVEVKGVTLEENGVARFPDAPTERGIKHLEELIRAREAGYEAAVCFIVQMSPIKWMEPNDMTHPAFGEALRRAAQAGVEVMALECAVTPDTMAVRGPIPVHL